MLVDGAERLGELSYIVPKTLEVSIGDAVEVPFGTKVRRGLVTGVDDGLKATRSINLVYGRRSSAQDIAVARELAATNLCAFVTVAKRLAPSAKRGNGALVAGPVRLRDGVSFDDISRPVKLSEKKRRIEMVGPSVDMARLAALEATDLALSGQVLVLCATKEMVRKVYSEFESGAARLDVVPKKEDLSAWNGLVEGSVRIGIGTRASALWTGQNLVGVVVVDEDHPGHREVAMPYTSARDVAAKRTSALDIGLVLLSRNPSPAALGAGVKISVVGPAWPRTTILARSARARWDPELPRGLGAILEGAIGKEVLVVAGSSRSKRRCGSCKNVWWCETCLRGSCEHCSEICPKCASEDTLIIGWDVAKSARVTGMERVVAPREIASASPADVVVLLDIDSWLSMAELVPGRVASDRILEAAHLVRTGGHLVIVTCEPMGELLAVLVKGDLLGLARRTWEQAKAEALPPFGRQITISGVGRVPTTTSWPGRVLGPKRISDSEWEFVILAKNSEMASFTGILERLRRRGKVRVTVL